MNISELTNRLEALAAGPKPWECVSTYDNGDERILACHSEAAANNHAAPLRRKVGKPLIRRETGETVVITSVVVRRQECVA